MKVAGAFASIFLLIIAFSAQPTSADPAVDGTRVSIKLPPNSVDIEPIRYGAAIYDPVRARMVTFGGRGNLYTQNVVSAALLEAPASWQAVPTAGYVSPR